MSRCNAFFFIAITLSLFFANVSYAGDFVPEKGASFNVRVENFVLDEFGGFKKVDMGILPLERQAILAIKGNGYQYNPNGGARYLVMIRVSCVNPREAVTAEVGRAFANSIQTDPWSFMPPLVTDVHVYSPSLDKLPDNVCAGVIVVGIGQQEDGGRKLVFHDHATLNCGYEMGCPFTSCEQISGNALAKYLGEIFP